MNPSYKQLNPFEIKSALNSLLGKINSPQDISGCLADFEMFDAQEDKTVLSKLLFKELLNAKQEKIPVICFLLERYVEKQELINKFWEILKNPNLHNEIKITILNILRELDTDWSYQDYNEYVEDAKGLLDESTKQLLKNAIINPEVQIDFMDFLASISVQDKITLLNSFEEDFEDDALANILVPVVESEPNSPQGKRALEILGQTKSQLALNVLEKMNKTAKGELSQSIRKSLATLKMSGIRENNTKEFYKKILSDSTLGDFYVTYPDGRGDLAMIFTRITSSGKVRFVSIVTNIDKGIRDCFGFFEISKFECEKILERFLKDERTVRITKESFNTILFNAENKTIEQNQQDWKLPYEYVCWKNLLIDIDYEQKSIEQILKEQLVKTKIDRQIFEQISEMKVDTRWFLDENYSDEFEMLIKNLKGSNLDNLVESNTDTIFYEEEKLSWLNKILLSAYIKLSANKIDDAQKLYSLAQNDALLGEFFQNLLKRSIYEYFLTIKYNKDLNSENISHEEIDKQIDFIEKNWTKK